MWLVVVSWRVSLSGFCCAIPLTAETFGCACRLVSAGSWLVID